MKVCLVLEGGAMRGLYTAGVLDALLDTKIKINTIIGVSAGALFGVNYASKQKGRSLRYNKKYCKDKRYMSLSDERIYYLHTRIGEILSKYFKCKPNGGYSKIYQNQKNYINKFSNFICNVMNVEHIITDFFNEELYEKKFKENKNPTSMI